MTTQNRCFGVVIGQALGFDCADALFSTDLQSARSRVAARLGQGGGTSQAAQFCLHPVRGQLSALPPPVRQQAGDHPQHRAPGRRGVDVQPCLFRRAGLLGRTHDAGHGDARAAGAAAATGAAADTPNFSSIASIRSTMSMTLISAIASNISSLLSAIFFSKCYLYKG